MTRPRILVVEDDREIRETLLEFEDLPAALRHALVIKLSQTLAGFVVAREWLAEDRALRVAKEACEKATVTLAAETPYHEVRPLIRHLRETGQLTAGLILRALLSGNLTMFEEALGLVTLTDGEPQPGQSARLTGPDGARR